MTELKRVRHCTLTDKQLVDKVQRMSDVMFEAVKIPKGQIPLNPNHDFNLLLDELIYRFNEKVVEQSK